MILIQKIRIEDLAAANKELNKKTTIIQDLVQNKVKEISELAEQKSPLFWKNFNYSFLILYLHFLKLIRSRAFRTANVCIDQTRVQDKRYSHLY